MSDSTSVDRHLQLILQGTPIHIAIIQQMSEVSSPKSVESSTSNSTFKSIKKKIRNKFRLSRADSNVKTLAQAVQTLKRSDDFLTTLPQGNDQIKEEFKGIFAPNHYYFKFVLDLRETLESVINQNQLLFEAVKSVDSSCPDPFDDAEKFSVYFAQKSLLSGHSFSEDNELDVPLSEKEKDLSSETENALLRLQNLRMEELRGFQTERENYESRIGQISVLEQEIDHLRKEKLENEVQIEFLKSQKICDSDDSARIDDITCKYQGEILALNQTIEKLQISINSFEEAAKDNVAEINSQNLIIADMKFTDEMISQLKQEIALLQNKLDSAHSQITTLQSSSTETNDERDRQIRSISEENERLKLEMVELRNQIFETKKQLSDIEVYFLFTRFRLILICFRKSR